MSMGKGIMKAAFERALKIPHQHQAIGPDDNYSHGPTQKLWLAFKAGVNYTPTKGSFVIAEINQWGLPEFSRTPFIHEFKDAARLAMRDQAVKSGAVCVVYQQVSAFNPARPHPKIDPVHTAQAAARMQQRLTA